MLTIRVNNNQIIIVQSMDKAGQADNQNWSQTLQVLWKLFNNFCGRHMEDFDVKIKVKY